jgi:hypothetical protein
VKHNREHCFWLLIAKKAAEVYFNLGRHSVSPPTPDMPLDSRRLVSAPAIVEQPKSRRRLLMAVENGVLAVAMPAPQHG